MRFCRYTLGVSTACLENANLCSHPRGKRKELSLGFDSRVSGTDAARRQVQVAGLLWRGILGACDGGQIPMIDEKIDVGFRCPGQRGCAKQSYLSSAAERLIDCRASIVTRLEDEYLQLTTQV